MNIPEVGYTGSLQTTGLFRQQMNGETEWVGQQTATLGLESYIWQPWLVTTRGRLSFAYEYSGGEDSGQALNGSGEGTIAVLPLSRYPVTLDFAHIDSRVEGDYAGSDFVQDRASITARANFNQNLRAGFNAGYNSVNRQDDGVLQAFNASTNASYTFGKDEAFLGLRSIGFVASLEASEFDSVDEENGQEDSAGMTGIMQFTIDAAPRDDLNFNSVSSYVYELEDSEADAYTRNTLQSVSTLQWRPDELPFVITSALRALAEQVVYDDPERDADSTLFLVSATTGASWPVNDNLSLTAGLNAVYSGSDEAPGAPQEERTDIVGSQFEFGGLVGYSYNSDPVDLGGFDWRWDSNGTADAGFRTEDGFVTSESVSVGHSFTRMLEGFYLSPLRLTLDERVTTGYDNIVDDPIRLSLNHSIGLDYSAATGASSTFANLLLRDSRELVGDMNEFQSAQTRFSHRRAIDRERALQGEVVGQFTRQTVKGEADNFLALGASASYHDREFLGVEGLDFSSEMELNVTGISDVFGRREEKESEELLRNDWRNLLRYRIGLLTLSAEATLFHTEKDFGYLVLLRARRDFGGVF